MSKSTVVIPINGKKEEARVSASTSAEREAELGHHWKTAFFLGVSVFVGCLGAALALVVFFPATMKYALKLLTICFLAGTVSFGYYGTMWSRSSILRPWLRADQEWQLEKDLRERALNGEDGEADDEPRSPGWRLEAVGYKILVMHFSLGLEATRDECQAEGITQGEWASVNKILQEHGIKGKRGWSKALPDDINVRNALAAEALNAWSVKTTFFEDGRASVWKSKTQSVIVR